VDLDALKSAQKEKDRVEDEKRRQEYISKMPENLGSIEVHYQSLIYRSLVNRKKSLSNLRAESFYKFAGCWKPSQIRN
jgi:hypothetical protein